MIPSEISLSGDYLRLESNKGWKIGPASGDLTNQICEGAGIFDQKVFRGGFDRFLKICPGLPKGDSNAWN